MKRLPLNLALMKNKAERIHARKLVLARIRWKFKFIREAIHYSDVTREYQDLKSIQKEAHEHFLKMEREQKDRDGTSRAKGELQMINKIINGR